MEEWDFVDERELQNWKGARICLTCQHFTYGVDTSCRTMVACSSDRNSSNRETISPSAAGSGVRPGRTKLDDVPKRADQKASIKPP